MNTGRAVLFKTAADVGMRASGLLTFPIVAHYVGAEGYGAYTQVATVVGVIVPLASLGIGASMVRYFSTQEWSRGLSRQMLRVGGVVTALALGFAVLVAVLAGPLNDAFLGYSDGVALFRWGALLVVTGAVEVWVMDMLRSRDWLYQYAGVQLGQTVALIAATAILLTSGYGIVELLAATVAIKVVALATTFVVLALRGRRAGDVHQPAPRQSYGRMIRFGLPLTMASLGLWIVHLSDRLVVGGIAGAAEVGRYGIVYSLATLLVIGGSGLYLPAYARLMRWTVEGDHDAVTSDIRLFHRYLTLVLVPMAVWLAVVIKPAVLFLGGHDFEVSELVALLVVIALFLNQWNGLSHYLLVAHDRTTLQQNVWLGAGALNIGLCLLLVPAWGIEGAAGATLACFVLIEGVLFREANRHVDLVREYRWGTAARAGLSAAAGAAVTLAVLAALPAGGFELLLATLAFCSVYLAAVVGVGEVGSADVGMLKRTVRPRPAMAEG